MSDKIEKKPDETTEVLPETPELTDAELAALKKKKLIAIGLAAAMVLSVTGGVTIWWKKTRAAAHHQSVNKSSGNEADEDDGKPPIYTQLEKIVVKLQRGTSPVDHYLQTTIELKLADAHTADKLKQYSPAIQYEIILILSSKNADWLDPVENKKKLSQEIRDKINSIIKAESSKEGVRAVYLTSFILQ